MSAAATIAKRRWWLGLAAALLLASACTAEAAEFPLPPGTTAIGAIGSTTIEGDETLLDLARRFDIGYADMVAANPGVDPWLPGAGRKIVLPGRFLLPQGPRRGIVVNLAERRLFYFPPRGGTVETYPVGVAVDGLDSPLGTTRVVAKETDPVWYPPRSILAKEPGLPRAVMPGPANPLGHYALHLGWPGYLIHGTNKPDGVGRNVSHGCLHLYPEDIARLYREVAVGTPVRVIDEPTLVEWVDGALFLELHPSKQQTDAIDIGEKMPVELPADLVKRIAAAAGDRIGGIDWAAVMRAARARNGIPVEIIPPAALAKR